jgi:hypothetical protein
MGWRPLVALTLLRTSIRSKNRSVRVEVGRGFPRILNEAFCFAPKFVDRRELVIRSGGFRLLMVTEVEVHRVASAFIVEPCTTWGSDRVLVDLGSFLKFTKLIGLLALLVV